MPRKVSRVHIAFSLTVVALVAFAAVKFVSYAQKRTRPSVVSVGPSVTATETLTDPASVGGNNDGKAQPGETLLATVTVTNPGPDATGVFLSDSPLNPLSPKGANGTFKIGPAAANYSYAGATGNIQFNIAAAQGVLSNSFLGSPAGTISAFDATSANGGTVSVAADGSFAYTSAPSFTGTSDSFTYTLSNGVGPARTGTVTIGLSSRVLFVSSTGGVTNCRSATPCSLATADGFGTIVSGSDLVYVLSGTYNSAAFSMNLLNQRLVGQGVSLAQALTDAGIVLDARSTNPGTAANTRPIFNNTTASIVTLAPGSLVEDLSINPSGANTTAGITGTNILSATATIRDLSVTATNAANAVTLTSNTGGTFNFSNVALTAASGFGFSATGGGTVNATQNNTTIVNTLTTTTGTALNVVNTTIGASGLTFRSISATGGSSGIVLNNTGSTGGLNVTGVNSVASAIRDTSGGTIQSSTGAGISLTNTTNAAFNNVNIQSTGDSGVNGTQVTNFGFTNGTISNAGNAGHESAIAFNTSPGTANNIAGTLTMTGNSITNAFYGGLDIESSDGTVSNATVSGNTITNPGFSGVNIVGTGTSTTAFNINNATIANNNITSSGGNGIQVNVGNSSTSGPGAHAGFVTIDGLGRPTSDASHIISITGNSISLDGTGTQAIAVSNTGANSASRTQTNFEIKNNGTVATPLSGSLIGSDILIGNNGYSDMAGVVDNNVIDAHHTAGTSGGGGNGIAGGNGVAGAGNAWTPRLQLAVTNNAVSDTNGSGILLVSRGATGTGFFKIASNNVAAPNDTGGFATNGIEVDAGNVPSADDAVFLDIFSNTSAGTNGALGIGFYKQGNVATTNDFGIFDAPGGPALASSPTNAQVQTFVASLNSSTVEIFNGSNFIRDTTLAPTLPAGGDGSGSEAALTGTPRTSRTIYDQEINQSLGGTAEIALAEPVVNVLGSDIARSEVIAIPHLGTTEDKPSLMAELYDKLTRSIEPTVEAQRAPTSGSITTTPTFTLTAGSSVTITYQLTVANGPYPAALDNLPDAGTVSGSNFSTVTASPVATIPLDASPSISIANTDSATEAQPGTTITYAVSATNANIVNGQDATGVVLTQTVPANSQFNAGASSVGWSGPGCVNLALPGTVCTFALGNLAANGTPASANFAVDVTGPLPGNVLSISDTSSVADDGTNGANQNVAQGTPVSQLDTDTVRGTWVGNVSTDFFNPGNWVNGLFPNPPQNISIPGAGAGINPPTINSGAFLAGKVFLGRNLTINSGAGLIVNNVMSLSTSKVLGAGTLEIGPGGSITRTTGQVNCALQKDFQNGAIPPPGDGAADVNAPDAPDAVFTFPTGSVAGYFPVDVTPTGGSTGSLTIQTVDNPGGVLSTLDPTKTLGRYWTVSGGAGITASMKFSYSPIAAVPPPGTKVNGNEANYKPQRVTGGVPTSFFDNCPSGTCVDQTNHFIFMPVVSNGSFAGNWTASEIAPTAAQVAISGRVLSSDGQAIRGVSITLDDGTGHAMTAISNAFGYYNFSEVQSGGTYILNATARGYTFTPRVISVNDELTDVTLTALP